MANNRKVVINVHSSENRAPSGSTLNYGEIAVSHSSKENASLYTKISDDVVAKFISEDAINGRISGYTDSKFNDLTGIVQNLANLTITDIKATTPINATEKALVAESCGNTVTISHVANKTAQSGFKKLTTDTYGHVTGGEDVVIGDISGLQGFDGAIKGAETKLAYSSAGTGNAVTSISVNDHTITANFGKEFSESGHKHDGSDITGGTVGIGHLPTSTAVTSSSDDTTIPTSKAVYDAVNGVVSGVVNGLDKTASSAQGQFVRTVIQENGLVSESKDFINVNDVKLSAVTPSSTTVKEEYALYNGNGVQLGDSIKIYKDSALKEVYLGHFDDALISENGPEHTNGTGETALCFIYYTVDGKYQLAAVNVQSFLEESEFKDGLLVDNHQVKVKIDNTSESFLTVGENGVKLSGVQGAIDNAISGVNTKLQELSGSVQTLSSTTKSFSAATVAEIARVEGKLSDNEKVIAESFNQLRAKVDKTQEGAGLNEDGSYVPHSTANYIAGATSLDDADMKLDSAVKALAESMTGYSKAFIIDITGDGSAENPYAVDKTREEVAAALAANSLILLKGVIDGTSGICPLIWATDYPSQAIVLQFGNIDEASLIYTTMVLIFSYQEGAGVSVRASSTKLATDEQLTELSEQVQTLSGSVVSIENREQNYASAITINGNTHTVANNSVDLGSFLSANTAHITAIQQESTASAVTTTINYVTENGSNSAATITQDLIIDCGTY